jgi:predicted ATPase
MNNSQISSCLFYVDLLKYCTIDICIGVQLMFEEQFIIQLSLKHEKAFDYSKYPFCIPAVKGLKALLLHPNVTFFVGENGSGKSTLLEALAVAYGFNPEGGSKNFNFATNATHSELYKYIKLQKGIKMPKDGYFLRAESFYNVASYLMELDEIPAASAKLTDAYGGKSLHEQSHGESFFSLFENRLRGNGLYILDEPEAALSPMRQLSFLTRLHQLVNNGSQFIIATHSPIIMSYPQSKIFQIDESGIIEVQYENTEHYQLSKAFFSNYKVFLKELL